MELGTIATVLATLVVPGLSWVGRKIFLSPASPRDRMLRRVVQLHQEAETFARDLEAAGWCEEAARVRLRYRESSVYVVARYEVSRTRWRWRVLCPAAGWGVLISAPIGLLALLVLYVAISLNLFFGADNTALRGFAFVVLVAAGVVTLVSVVVLLVASRGLDDAAKEQAKALTGATPANPPAAGVETTESSLAEQEQNPETGEHDDPEHTPPDRGRGPGTRRVRRPLRLRRLRKMG